MPRHKCVQHVDLAIRRAVSTFRRPPVRNSISSRRGRPAKPIHLTEAGARVSPVLTRGRALPWALASLTAGGIAFYGGALLVEALKPCRNPAIADLSQQKDVSGRYEDTADSFDSEVGLSEILMGINRMRKKLAKKCTGHVLEVSCGTGRNLGYYDISNEGSVESLTFVDLSPQMVEVCKKKWDVLFGTTVESDRLLGNKSFKPGLVVRFLAASALDSMPLSPNGKKYDTVIQTMGLCSTPAPKKLLENMIGHLNTANPEARILLLEHGRSYKSWLNKILDNSAEKHAEIHGCWFNRDIGALVEDVAEQTGLQVVDERRHHFGTTWVFELRPSAELVRRSTSHEESVSGQTQNQSWRSWLGLG